MSLWQAFWGMGQGPIKTSHARALMPRPRGVAKFAKRVSEFTKIAIFGLFACKNVRNFVHLPCLFQPKLND
jgi:hypothetical protein